MALSRVKLGTTMILCGSLLLQATTWKAAVDGDWNDPDNWDDGVPNATEANINKTGASYTVTVNDTPSGVVSNILVSNDATHTTRLEIACPGFTTAGGVNQIFQNGEISVVDGGEWLHDDSPAGVGRNFSLKQGGRLHIDGGSVVFTNLIKNTSFFGIYAGDSSTGHIEVVDGTLALNGFYEEGGTQNEEVYIFAGFGSTGVGKIMLSGDSELLLHGPGNTSTKLQLGYYGRGVLEAGGTSRVVLGDDYNGTGSPLKTLSLGAQPSGTGVVHLKDQAQLISYKAFEALPVCNHTNTTGIITVSDNASFILPMQAMQGECQVGLREGSVGEITVRDYGNMQFTNSGGTVLGKLGKGYLTVRDHAFFEAGGGLYLCNGNDDDNGYGEVNLEGGTLSISNSSKNAGLTVANNTASGFARARFNMSGGCLKLPKGYYAYNWGRLDGVLVGKRSSKTIPGISVGEFNLSGGVVTNYGALTLGWGVGGTGTLHQTGGHFEQGQTVVNNLRNMVLGWAGGYGEYWMDGGTIKVYDPVYIGGVTTNQLQARQDFYDDNERNKFTWDQASTGILRVNNGVFSVINHREIWCGSHGAGTIAIGPTGACEARNIVLTNNTSSTVSFQFGPEGCGQLRASANLTVSEGARLEIDSRGYQGEQVRFKLIEYATRTGAFAPEDIEVTGPGQVEQRDDGIWFIRGTGTLMLIQ